MNIYWCNERGNNEGVYILAKTRNSAKYMASSGVVSYCYIDVNCKQVQKNVEANYECVITKNDKYLLNKYGLHYYDENGNEISNDPKQYVPEDYMLRVFWIEHNQYGPMLYYGYILGYYKKKEDTVYIVTEGSLDSLRVKHITKYYYTQNDAWKSIE